MPEEKRVVGGSRRPDGTYRKPVKVREGFLSEELDQFTYQSEGTKRAVRNKGYVPGGGGGKEVKEKTTAEKRAERRKRKKEKDAAAAVAEVEKGVSQVSVSAAPAAATPAPAPKTTAAAAPVDKEKALKKLKKLLRQIEKLEGEKANGTSLSPEQQAKLAKKPATVAEIKVLEA